MKSKSEKYKQIQAWRKRNKTKCVEYCRKYFEKNKEAIRQRRNQLNAIIKLQVIDKYGGQCATCTCSIPTVLSVDHIYNNGAESRRNGEQVGSNLYRILLKKNKRTDLQILCANCQWRKHVWGKFDGRWPTKEEVESFLLSNLKSTHPSYWKQYNLRIKNDLMTMYGGLCKRCQCDDILALTIDHVNSDGSKDRKNMLGQNFYRHLLKSLIREDLQILCFNCQIEKERNKNYA